MHHKHIIRMVSKEKYEDTVFRQSMKASGRKSWISVHTVADVVTLRLEYNITLADLGIVQYKDSIGNWKLALDSVPNITLLE